MANEKRQLEQARKNKVSRKILGLIEIEPILVYEFGKSKLVHEFLTDFRFKSLMFTNGTNFLMPYN